MTTILIWLAVTVYILMVLFGFLISFAAAGEKTPAWKIILWPFLFAWGWVSRD